MGRVIWKNDAETAALRAPWQVDGLPLPFRFAAGYWRYSPVKRGGTRLVYAISRIFGEGAQLKATVPGFFTITCDLNNTQYLPLYTCEGIYEPDTLRVILNALEPGDVFCDVGCNWGFFSLLAAVRVGAQGKVYAFDPNPAVLKEGLCRHVAEAGLKNVFPECYAVSDVHDEMVELVIPASKASGNASIMVRDHRHHESVVRSRTVRLDRFFEGGDVPRLFKLDIEGAELKALNGCKGLLDAGARPIFVVEYAPDRETYRHSLADLEDFFRPYEYKIGWPVPGGVSIRQVKGRPAGAREANLIAMPGESLPFFAPGDGTSRLHG